MTAQPPRAESRAVEQDLVEFRELLANPDRVIESLAHVLDRRCAKHIGLVHGCNLMAVTPGGRAVSCERRQEYRRDV